MQLINNPPAHLHHLPDEPVEEAEDLWGRQLNLLLQLIYGLVLQAHTQQDRLQYKHIVPYKYIFPASKYMYRYKIYCLMGTLSVNCLLFYTLYRIMNLRKKIL